LCKIQLDYFRFFFKSICTMLASLNFLLVSNSVKFSSNVCDPYSIAFCFHWIQIHSQLAVSFYDRFYWLNSVLSRALRDVFFDFIGWHQFFGEEFHRESFLSSYWLASPNLVFILVSSSLRYSSALHDLQFMGSNFHQLLMYLQNLMWFDD